MTKIDLYGGLLGVGKTTVIRQLLKNGYDSFRVVIIENEIGKVNLDAAFLKGSGVTVRELTGGCVCCTIRGQLGEAIREIESAFHPDFIVMEPSGAADIRGIKEEIREIPEVSQGRFVLIVNAKKALRLFAVVGDFFLEQIRCSDLIYLNRADQMTKEELDRVREELLRIHPSACFVDKPVQELTLGDFPVSASPSDPEEGPVRKISLPSRKSNLSIQELDAPRRLTFGKQENTLYSWHWKLPEKISEEQYDAVHKVLSDTVHLELWRAKGVLRTEDGTVHRIDYVFGDYSEEDLTEVLPEIENGVVLIGTKIDRGFVRKVFEEAEDEKTDTGED